MSPSRSLLATGALLAALSAPAAGGAAEERRPFLLGGIQLHEEDHSRWAAALIRSGMNAVEVTVYAHQGAWNGARLWWADEEPAVLAEIREARRHGLQVVLVLRLALDHNEPENRFLWHGLVFPDTEARLDAWFRLYGGFVLKWARLAEAEGVDVLALASEMNSLTATLPVAEVPELAAYYLDDGKQRELAELVARHRHLFSEVDLWAMGAGDFGSLEELLAARNRAERRWARAYSFDRDGAGEEERVERINRRRQRLQRAWEALIEDVRAVYGGRLTLADNFDNYRQVGFWHLLDLIGINAYFPLRPALESPLGQAELEAAWRRVFAEVEAFRRARGLDQPVVFTELGYTRKSGVTVAPWSSDGFVPLWDEREGVAEKDHRVLLWSARPTDPQERALALAALHSAWRADRLPLAGILYWKLSSRLDLARYEPFMLYLGGEAGDPLFDAFTRFASDVRPLSPLGEGPWAAAAGAVLSGDLEALAAVAAEGPPPPPPGRAPLLHLAARQGRGEAARRLLRLGADPGERDASGALALHRACARPDPGLVEPLLPGPGVSWADDRGETPLHACARLDNAAVAGALLRLRGDLAATRDGRSQSALRLAADQASRGMVELLLAHGARADDADDEGVTPLHAAARRGDPAIVEPLAAASPGDLRDAAGNRPVDHAAYFGQAKAFTLLFRPETARAVNAAGQGLLHHAAHGGDAGIVGALLRHGLEVDRADREGRTPLHFAAMKAHRAAAQSLLEAGAEPGRADSAGRTALHLAAEGSDAELLRLLLARARAVDPRDAWGATPLHYAASWGRVENVRLLVDAGARPDLRDAEGRTPLALAETSGRRRVVELFARLAPPTGPPERAGVP